MAMVIPLPSPEIPVARMVLTVVLAVRLLVVRMRLYGEPITIVLAPLPVAGAERVMVITIGNIHDSGIGGDVWSSDRLSDAER